MTERYGKQLEKFMLLALGSAHNANQWEMEEDKGKKPRFRRKTLFYRSRLSLEGDCRNDSFKMPISKRKKPSVANDRPVFSGYKTNIENSSVVIVNRFGRKFTCTCNPDRRQFMNSLPNVSAAELDKLHLPCLHIITVQDILNKYASFAGCFETSLVDEEDSVDHTYSRSMPCSEDGEQYDETAQEPFEVIPFMRDMYVICVDGRYSVLKTSFGSLKCLMCNKSDDCKHVDYINKLLKSNEETEDSDILNKIYSEIFLLKSEKEYTLKCHSHKRIPFLVKGETISQGLSNFQHIVEGVLQVYPEHVECCGLCGNEYNARYEPLGNTSYVLTKYECRTVQVFFRRCRSTTCDGILHYDGQSDCLLNLERFLVHYEVLRDFMFHILYSRTSMFSFYNVWVQHQTDSGHDDFKKVFRYHYFRQAWFYFLSRLDIDYAKDFMCNECGDHPSVLLFDGTALSFKKKFLPKMPELDHEGIIFSGRHMDRVFINNKSSRDLLYEYSRKEQGITNEQFNSLKNAMIKHQPALVPMLETFEEIGCTASPPEEYKELLSVLSKNSPVCGTFHYGKIELIQQSGSENAIQDSNLLLNLQNYIPVVFRLLTQIHEIPEFLKVIFEEITKKVCAPFKNEGTHQTRRSGVESPLSYFPNLPKVRERGLYTADKDRLASGCSKKGTRHPVLLPGIFTVFCKHGRCYGFEIMECAESPNRPFSFLKTRFEEAPAVIIYDNACNLHQYALNRDPSFFANTLMVVDGLHWDNHTACAIGYKALDYPLLKSINTQMVEQNNSKLKKLKSTLSYMTSDNFMSHLKFFLWFCNRKCVS